MIRIGMRSMTILLRHKKVWRGWPGLLRNIRSRSGTRGPTTGTGTALYGTHLTAFVPSGSHFLPHPPRRSSNLLLLVAATSSLSCSSLFPGRSRSTTDRSSRSSSSRIHRYHTTDCQQRPPLRRPLTFGPSIIRQKQPPQRRWFHTLSDHDDLTEVASPNNTSKADREDCPICARYSQGPCGPLFETWLQCTDDHPGTDPTTGQDLHLRQCQQEAAALGACLEIHQPFYDNLRLKEVEQAEKADQEEKTEADTTELQDAWERLIAEDLKDLPRVPFPSKGPPNKPVVEIRPRDRTAVVMVPLRTTLAQAHALRAATVLVVLVQDQATQQLLSAGSLDDLFRYTPHQDTTTSTTTSQQDEFGVLQCTLPETTREILVSVLYEPEDHDNTDNGDEISSTATVLPEPQVIYTYRVRVPEHLEG